MKFARFGLLISFVLLNILSADEIESNSQDSIESKNIESTNNENSQTTKTYNLEKVAVTAKGTEQLLKDAPASITVITGEELENRAHRDIAEALNNIPGVDINGDRQGKTGGLNIRIRGMEGKYTLILIDGKRQTSGGADINTTDNSGWAQANTSFMPPLSAIERIEVIRGPMSTLYGSDAIGGVVNIITKKKIDKFGVSLGLETTQNENRNFGSSYILNLFSTIPIIKDKLGVQLRGRYFFREQSNIPFTYTPCNTTTGANGNIICNSHQDTKVPVQDSQKQSTQNVNGFSIWEHERKQANIYDIGARILWNLDSKNNIYFDAQFGQQIYDNPHEALGPYTQTARNYIVMNNNYLLSHKGNYDNWSIDNSIQFIQSFNDGRVQLYDPTQNRYPQNVTAPRYNRDIQGKDVIIESKAFVDLPANNFLTLGAQYWYAYMQDKIVVPSSDAYHTFSLFAENEWEALDNLRLTLGVREDYNSKFGFNTSPKAYIVYEALPDWLIFKGGVSMGYKAPFLNQMTSGIYGFNSSGTGGFLGNPDLKPETSLNAEISIISDNDYFEAGATYFYSLFWDKIALTRLSYGTRGNAGLGIAPENEATIRSKCRGNYWSLGCYLPDNVDRSYIQGVELYVGLKALYGVSFDIAYTYTDSNQLTGDRKGNPLNGTINHRVSAKLGYSFLNLINKDVYIYAQGEYQGKRSIDSADNPWDFYKPYGLLHLGATYKINKNFKLNFAVYNVLDFNFMDFMEYSNGARTNITNRYIVLQEGRRYWLSLDMNF